MVKFIVVQKQRRVVRAQIKRDAYGDPLTKKLKIRQQPTYVSNKQKEALQMGLTNMEDVEMAVVEEDIETWLKFASLCRKDIETWLKFVRRYCGRVNQARSTLVKLLQYDPEASKNGWYSRPPQVMLAYLKYQWSLGEDIFTQ
ncbi:serine/threonine-protein kinase TOR isoform X3 [Cucumis melo var. makuwa]|uniref:Serine/threonine-protein kinase TOR isoform X3 n=1 Tax=Cucumis melo var. makuwa TaxID=1194695 RepID=A0A5D3CXQ9_CUCMM|nr:serine/threonine-protein kinase TOR isoform X3 [Cucumis melo var. makuwa]